MRKMEKLSVVYLTIVFVILYAPIFYLMYYSFNSAGTMHSLSLIHIYTPRVL